MSGIPEDTNDARGLFLCLKAIENNLGLKFQAASPAPFTRLDPDNGAVLVGTTGGAWIANSGLYAIHCSVRPSSSNGMVSIRIAVLISIHDQMTIDDRFEVQFLAREIQNVEADNDQLRKAAERVRARIQPCPPTQPSPTTA